MSINFFETDCKELPKKDVQFGICDDQNGIRAYTDVTDCSKWIAKIQNDSEREVSFTPIDHCLMIYKEGTNEKESSCDGMLTFEDSLFLVELKDQRKDWISEAKNQLENTIRLMTERHDLSPFRYKKAFACNRKHPDFKVLEASEKKSFFERTKGFRMDIQATIVIK